MRTSAYLLAFIMCAGFLLLVIPGNTTASGGGDAAKLDEHLDVTCIPGQQSIGGEVEITATFTIYGGCCYHLYTYDVVPVPEFPEGIQILNGPSPEKYDMVDGVPGGEPVVRTFTWRALCNIDGNLDIKIKLETDNCGSVEGSTVLKVTEGAIVNPPRLFPAQPETSRDIIMEYEVFSSLDGVTVDEVKMYYYISENEIDQITAEEDKVTITEGGKNKTVSGNEIAVENSVLNEATYRSKIPKQDEEVFVYYWIYAQDSKGMTITTSVYETKTSNEQDALTVMRIVFTVFVILSIVGVVAVMYIHQRIVNSAIRDKTKLFRLGSTGNTEYMSEKDKPTEPKPIILYAAIALVMVVGIILVVLAITSGSYVDIIQHLRDGK